MTEQQTTRRLERRAMILSMIGNLFMGAVGVYAAYLSNSQAILMDGLFSLVGFTAAFLGMRVAANANRQPNKLRPFGYAADEALFVTFRSLTLIGLVLFAMTNAGLAILNYINGHQPAALVFKPMMAYFGVIGLTCVLLWGFHRWSWHRAGRNSEVLLIESKAAAFDGLITAAAGIGLLGIELLRDGILAPVAPIGDSLIVLVLCATVLAPYFKDFIGGLGELAGITAQPQHLAAARRALRPTLQQDGGTLHDLSVSKLGREFTVMVYYDPGRTVSAQSVDALALRLQQDLAQTFPLAQVYVILSEQGRALAAK